MKKKIDARLLAKLLLGLAALIGVYLWLKGPNLAAVVALIVCLFSAGFLVFNKQPANLALLLFSTLFTYLIVELLFFVFLHSKFEKFNLSQKTFYSAGSVSVDTLAGYRFKPNSSIRTIRYIHGVKVYDNTFKTNNLGYVAPFPFVQEKAADVVRIAVLGDSFSEGIFLEKSYPNRLQEMFSKEGKKVEIYNFSMDGGGIANWYRVFFGEIMKLGFDKLIIASYPDDIDRDLAVFHAFSDGLYFFRTPATTSSTFTAEDLQRRVHEQPVYHVADLVSDKAKYKDREIPFGLYIYKYLNNRFRSKFESTKHSVKTVPVDQHSGLLASLKPYEQKHGSEKMRELAAIIDTCNSMHKPVLLISIPDITMLQKLHETKYAAKNEHQQEMEAMASIFHSAYFDGYAVFRDMTFEDIITNAWLKFDGHWGQKGSDIFAGKLYAYLNSGDSTFVH